MKNLLTVATLFTLLSSTSFADTDGDDGPSAGNDSSNSTTIQNRVNEIYPNQAVDFNNPELNGESFIALTGQERADNEFNKAMNRANKICYFLKYKRGALGYEVSDWYREGTYQFVREGELKRKYFKTDYALLGSKWKPRVFSKISCLKN